MCKHCEKLVEDKQIVHDFMEVAAIRLSEKHRYPIDPDELDVVINVSPQSAYVRHLRDQADCDGYLLEPGSDAHVRAMGILNQAGKIGEGL